MGRRLIFCVAGSDGFFDHVTIRPTSFRLNEGAGSSVITASFRADVPIADQQYGLQIFDFGAEELVNVLVGRCDTQLCITGLYVPPSGQANRVAQSVFVDLAGVQRVLLRLTFTDGTNRVVPSFSLNGGASLQTLPFPSLEPR